MLDSTALKILKFINKSPNSSADSIGRKIKSSLDIKEYLSYLRKEGYLTSPVKEWHTTGTRPMPAYADDYRITPKGMAILSMQKTETIKYWIPIIFSVLLSVISFIANVITS